MRNLFGLCGAPFVCNLGDECAMKKLIATLMICASLPLAYAAEEGASGKKPNPTAIAAATVSVSALRVETERAHIVELVNRFNDAAVHNDIKTMDRMLAKDYLAVDSENNRTRKGDLIRAHRQGLIRYTSVNAHDFDVQLNGDTAIEKDVAEVRGIWRDKPFSGSYASVRTFKKRDGRWQIVAFEVTGSK